ncbi:MAG: divalent-cation tolerance protein CutA [Nitrospiraceae bacterium]|nr:divalent-cation tolerance protein CutA [Nitrospiraceae bacterium]
MQEDITEIVVLVTAASQEEAEHLGQKVIERKLAACLNVVRDIRSLFRWEGRVNVETECLLIFKSSRKCYQELEQIIKENHSYSVPEVIALPIIAGSAPYLQWIRDETRK